VCVSLGSFKLLAHSFCFFPFAKEMTFLHFVYSSCTPSMPLSIFLFSNFHTFSPFPLLLLQFPHSTTMFPFACMGLLTIHIKSTCALSIIIFFICCQCSFTSNYFHSASSVLSLTMRWYSSRVFSFLSFHTHALGSNFLHHLYVVLNHMSITKNLCFGTHASFGMVFTLHIMNLCFVLLSHNNIINRTFNGTSCICQQLRFLLHEQCFAND